MRMLTKLKMNERGFDNGAQALVGPIGMIMTVIGIVIAATAGLIGVSILGPIALQTWDDGTTTDLHSDVTTAMNSTETRLELGASTVDNTLRIPGLTAFALAGVIIGSLLLLVAGFFMILFVKSQKI